MPQLSHWVLVPPAQIDLPVRRSLRQRTPRWDPGLWDGSCGANGGFAAVSETALISSRFGKSSAISAEPIVSTFATIDQANSFL